MVMACTELTLRSAGTRESCAYLFAIRRQCSHAAAIRFSLASGVRNAECADSVTLSQFRQRMIRRQRLDVEDVEPGMADLA